MHTKLSSGFSSFADLPLAEPLLDALLKMAWSQPTPVQQQTIPLAMERQDLLVSAETGSGKTLAFLIPLLHRLLALPAQKHQVRGIILAPTRELALQLFGLCRQLAELTPLKIGLIIGGDGYSHQQTLFKFNTDIIVSTPGRLLAHLQKAPDILGHIDVLIIDEADRMLDMGFRDDVLNIAGCCNKNRQTLLFSATLIKYGVVQIADKLLKSHKTIVLNNRFDGNDNIEQQIVLADDISHKIKLLAWLLNHETYDKALIFTNTKYRAEDLQGPLRGQKLRVAALHGDMDPKERARIMALYHDGKINILIATDIAARGLDIKGVDLVVNFDVPRNGIDYIHRIGRTGRADESGLAIALVKSTEWNLMASIERFLRQRFQRRIVSELVGNYQGPKKMKSSGKSAGVKKKKEEKKTAPVKVKIRHEKQKNIGKRRIPTSKLISD